MKMPEPIKYGFDEQLAMSNGFSATADVKDILLQSIPGSVNVVQAAKVNDKQGVDWWVEMATASFLAVDAKVREKDWAKDHPEEDDLALETWSVVESNIVGWTRDPRKRCDYVIWLWKDTGRFCLVPFPMLCHVFSKKWKQWAATFKTCRQKTTWDNGREYHSECVFVPRKELWAELYRVYGGDGKIQQKAKLAKSEPKIGLSFLRQAGSA